jgi:hypothetical protein
MCVSKYMCMVKACTNGESHIKKSVISGEFSQSLHTFVKLCTAWQTFSSLIRM